MSKLLFDEHPLVILPSVAEKIGLNEAIVLQQINYWIQANKQANRNYRDGKHWTYNSVDEWQRQFRWWSRSTIKRTLKNLEDKGILVVGNYNKRGFDKTKWYSINKEKFSQLMEEWSNRLGQNEPTSGSKWTNGEGQSDPTNTRDYPETNSDSSNPQAIASAGSVSRSKSARVAGNPDGRESGRDDLKDKEAIKQVIDHLNKVADKNYRSTTKATQRVIRARLADGFTVEDLIKVIDIKVAQWANDAAMNQYLRPETLFNTTKFEGYLNQGRKANNQGNEDRYGGLYLAE